MAQKNQDTAGTVKNGMVTCFQDTVKKSLLLCRERGKLDGRAGESTLLIPMEQGGQGGAIKYRAALPIYSGVPRQLMG